MNPITHFLTGWALTLPCELSRGDRALVVVAAVAPDADAFGAIGDFLQGRPLDSYELYARYHHVVGHNILFAAALTVGCALLARRKLVVGGLAALAVHIHFLEDVVGSGGPDGSQWEIPYLLPFSPSWQWSVPWQWALNAWPNVAFTTALLALALCVAWSRGLSPVGLFSARADAAVVRTLRERFGDPRS